MSQLDKFREGDIRALSRIISYVENRRDGYQELLGRLYDRVGTCLRIGITGPPGAGKSTLVNGLARRFLQDGKKVGIIAVDPTSPFTGGALLGDRVRMNDLPSDGSVYFRSMATRGATGGLAGATDNVAIVYDSFGFDITLIETVGVGQVELDIINTCDTVTVVIVPESGDAVQTLKAGLMEIADVFCINKADRPGAERIATDLRMTIDTRRKTHEDWEIPLVQTEAVNGKGLEDLYAAIHKHVDFRRKDGSFDEHRRAQLERKIRNIVKYRFQSEFLDQLTEETRFDRAIDDILAGKTDPFKVGDEFYEEFTAGR